MDLLVDLSDKFILIIGLIGIFNILYLLKQTMMFQQELITT